MDPEFLHCVGRAAVQHAARAIRQGVPFNDVVFDIARDALTAWKSARPQATDRRAELDQLAWTNASMNCETAHQVAGKVAPREMCEPVARYLSCLPPLLRRALAHAESSRFPDNPEDLISVLPPRVPRFEPGMQIVGLHLLILEELLGMGGFGEVWKARIHSWPGTAAVALKFCLDPRAARQLQHEAALNRVLNQGRHPGIVRLRHVHLHADPPCLEYEYVEGGDLARWIRTSMPAEERLKGSLALMSELADVLAFAHGLNPPVVHRDLKPSNILLQPRVTRTALRVTDFGIGGIASRHAMSLSPSLRGALTTGLRGAYTPHYASPEQKRGGSADPRDDVHALGVIWYQMLTGNVNREPGPGCRTALEKLRVPKDVIDLILSCLARADRRPANASVLAAGIRAECPAGA